jgi:uncharacterized protein (DUF2236 family)
MPIPLPGPAQRQIDAAARAFLQPQGGPQVDFTRPEGEPALVGPESLSWRIFKNPVALFVGGVAAVILELAEPRVRAGVWEHSAFRSDPVRRLQRTGLAAMVTVFGARSTAEAMIARVVQMHERVAGATEDGAPYRANDPELLTWVQATAVYGFTEAYSRYVRRLTASQRDQAYAEALPAARLYGALQAPGSDAERSRLFGRMAPRLDASPVVFEFLDIMHRAPIAPAPLRPAQQMLVRAAVDLTPEGVRARLGLGAVHGLRAWERPLVRAAARLSDRVLLNDSPAVQACLRLGLSADHLYRRLPA